MVNIIFILLISMITYATEQNTIIAFFINGTKMYFINLLLHIPTNLPYIWQFNAKKFLDLLTPNLHQFVPIKNPRGQCLRSPSPLWIWMINGAKLGGAIGAMAPLVFWSRSLKKSRNQSLVVLSGTSCFYLHSAPMSILVMAQ